LVAFASPSSSSATALAPSRPPRIRTLQVCHVPDFPPAPVWRAYSHAVCGPPKYAEIRINLAQAFNGIGTVIAPVLGSYVFFAFSDAEALQNVQWVYIAIAIFVFILGTAFWLSVIPEITDADMAFQATETHANADDKPFWKQYQLFHAAFAQFCYTGAQIAVAS
jgi:FHS family L-fucose permease-like MFS transporter